jgi:hypothetical protein
MFQTKSGTRILDLDGQVEYSWISTENVGEILVTVKRKIKANYLIVRGKYRLYEVKDEAGLTDLNHLELYVGEGHWQGFLLPTGLPGKIDIRNKIIPTSELITQTSNLRALRQSSVV